MGQWPDFRANGVILAPNSLFYCTSLFTELFLKHFQKRLPIPFYQFLERTLSTRLTVLRLDKMQIISKFIFDIARSTIVNNSHAQQRQRREAYCFVKVCCFFFNLIACSRKRTWISVWFESCAEYKREKRAQLESSATRVKHVFRHEDKTLCSILHFWFYTKISYWIKWSRKRSHLKEIVVLSFVDRNCC